MTQNPLFWGAGYTPGTLVIKTTFQTFYIEWFQTLAWINVLCCTRGSLYNVPCAGHQSNQSGLYCRWYRYLCVPVVLLDSELERPLGLKKKTLVGLSAISGKCYRISDLIAACMREWSLDDFVLASFKFQGVCPWYKIPRTSGGYNLWLLVLST